MESGNNPSEPTNQPLEDDWVLPCLACGHLKFLHGGACLADLHRTQALWHDSGFGFRGRCWCSAFTIDPAAASREIMKHGDAPALVRGVNEAIDRRDLDGAKSLRTQYLRKIPNDQRDDLWLADVERQLSELSKADETTSRHSEEHDTPEGQGEAALVRRITKAPPPIGWEASGRGGWISSKAQPAEVPTNFPPDFPSSLNLRTRVILSEVVKEFPDRSKLEQLCNRVVLRLTDLLCSAAKDGTLKAHDAPDRLNTLLHYFRVSNCDNANERFRVERAVINSEEWHAMLKQLAECEGFEPYPEPPIPDRVADDDTTRERIDAFIEKLLDAGHSITRRDIWQAAGYENATEFERFQRQDVKATTAAKANFNRILDMSPEDFMRVVKNRRPK